jgi:hypothetical protein
MLSKMYSSLFQLDDIWNKNIQTERDIAFRMVQDCRITTPEEQRLKNLTEVSFIIYFFTLLL